MNCLNCLENAERSYHAEQRAEAAIRCCETGHRPAYRRGRIVGQHDIERATAHSYRLGRYHGSLTTLAAVVGLGLVALALGERR